MSPGFPPRGRAARPDPASFSAVSRNAMISTDHPLATQAGLAALRKGGSAVDAYLAAAAVQTVVEPEMTSLAGVFSVTVYDPSTGESRVVGGLGAKPAAEDGDLDEAARWSGRTVVTPGWVRSAHTAWQTWGKLSWADVFSDALVCARDGFVVDQLLWGNAFGYRSVLGRHPEARQVWFADGHMACVGDVLRQPALARTIEQLAEQGPDYFYEGEFARHYVETARAAGGRITLDDMSATEAFTTNAPVSVLPLANGYELHTYGPMYALALNLALIGGLGKRGRPASDADSLYLLVRIVEECWHLGLSLSDGWAPKSSGLEDIADAALPENAEKLWPQVESGPPRPFDGMNYDTNAIVAVDSSGMVAHGTHSTSGSPFGAGLMVDGVFASRAMYFFANPVLPFPVGLATSLLAVRDDKPVFAAGSPGIALFQNVFQNTLNVLEWGMEPGDSVQQPRFGAAKYPSQRPMVEVTMGEEIIAEVQRRGIGLTPVSPWQLELGSCHAVRIDDDGTLRGAADPRRMGHAAGY